MSTNPNLPAAVALRRVVALLSQTAGVTVQKGVPNAVDIDGDGDKLRLSSEGKACRLAVTLDVPAPAIALQVPTRALTTAMAALTGGVAVEVGARLGLDDGTTALSLPALETPRGTWATAPTREHVVDGAALTLALGRVAHAIAPDENRYQLNGLCLDVEGGRSRFVATDGNRLAMADLDGDLFLGSKTLLPRGIVTALLRLNPTGPVRWEVGDKVLRISGAGFEVLVRIGESRDGFPDYRQFIPKAQPNWVVVDRDALAKAVRGVAKLALDNSNMARWAFADGAVHLSSRHHDYGTAKASVPAGLTGAPPTVGFNCLFIAQTLQVLPAGPVSISLGDKLAPTIWRSLTTPDTTQIIMPVSVD